MSLVLKESTRNRNLSAQSSYDLVEDKHKGFTDAVDNGQTRLALEYAVHLITEQNNELFYLRKEVEELKEGLSSESSKKATAAKKKAPAKKTKAEAGSEEGSVEDASDED